MQDVEAAEFFECITADARGLLEGDDPLECRQSARVDWVLDETHSHWERRTSRNPETIPRSVLSGKGILDGAECCKCGCALFGTNFELTCPDQRGVCLRAIFLARSEEHTSESQSLK